ncbi:uncharacterized protein TNCV_1038001 [Trichonephila clavipes]|nr:uncharacterized protein TNCV_1038001 [Trichonephila clavipes]
MGISSRKKKQCVPKSPLDDVVQCKLLAYENVVTIVILCSRQHITWPPGSSDTNIRHFWLWRYLKDMFYRDPITSLSDLKKGIERHVRNIPQFMLLSTVEHVILRFQTLADDFEQHIEYIL